MGKSAAWYPAYQAAATISTSVTFPPEVEVEVELAPPALAVIVAEAVSEAEAEKEAETEEEEATWRAARIWARERLLALCACTTVAETPRRAEMSARELIVCLQ